MRIPQELKDALDAASIENKRSLTAEVVTRLNRSFTSMKTVEEIALENASEGGGLKQQIEGLRKLLEEQKTQMLKIQQMQSKAIAAEVLKHLQTEAGTTIEAARQAVAELKAAGKWPPAKS